MKKLVKIFGLIIFVMCIQACEKDNYDPPKSQLSGKITYNGELIGLKGTNESVQLQLYEDGWQLRQPIPVYAKQDGTFDALLFDGTYKLVTRDNNGPWVNDRDTVIVEVRGRTECEIKVTPFFTLSDVQVKLEGNIATAKLTINKEVADAKIDKIMVILSKTQFADDTVNIGVGETKNGDDGEREAIFNFTGDDDKSKNTRAAVEAAHAVYARVGVKATAGSQAIYSGVFRVK